MELEYNFRNSIFGEIEKKQIFAMLSYGILCAICYELKLSLPLTVVVLFATVLTSFRNPSMTIGMMVLSLNFTGELLSGSLYTVVLVVILGVLALTAKGKINIVTKRNAIMLLIALSLIMISTIQGVSASVTHAISMTICVIAYIILLETKDNTCTRYIALAVIINGISMGLCVLHQFILGGSYINHGRVNFAGNSKILAIACAVPLLLLACAWLSDRALFSEKKKTIGAGGFLLIIVFTLLLIMTAAKGVFLSLIVSLAVFSITNISNKKMVKKTIPLILVFALILYFLSDSSVIRVSRLLDTSNNDSLTSRFDIWKYYYEQLKGKGVLRVLFGFGPGSLSRVANNSYYAGYYSHSTILDYLFCYGYIGFAMFISFLLSKLMHVMKSGNRIGLACLVLCIMMYSTHGSSENFYLYIMLAFITLMSNNYEYSEKRSF